MTMAKVKMGLVLLLAMSLAAGTAVLAYPLRSEKPSEAEQASAPKSQQRPSETSKPTRDQQAPTDLYGDPLPSGAIARLGTVRFRHGGYLTDVLVSTDGRTLISAGDRSVEIWDAQTGRRQRRFASSRFFVTDITLSPDGKLLAASYDTVEKMRFWNLVSGVEVHPFGDAAPQTVRAAFSPNGELLATLDTMNPLKLRIWDIRRGKEIRTIEGGKGWWVRSLAFSPNSKLLAFPGETGVRVWDVAAGKELFRLDLGAKTRLNCVVFSSDGKLLAAARDPYGDSQDHSIHLWDTATGKEAGELKGHEEYITALAMSPKSNVLASASRDGTIRFWDLAKRRETSRRQCSGWFSALAFAPDGRVLISGENNGRIRRWPVSQGEDIRTAAERANALGGPPSHRTAKR